MFRFNFVILLTLLSTLSHAQTEEDRRTAESRGFDGLLQSEHYALFFRTSETNPSQLQGFVDFIEDMHQRISNVVGSRGRPDRRIIIILAGHGISSDGRVRFPSVDSLGRVILVRFGDEVQSYADEATHEIVHAFRLNTGHWFSGFWEEGIAEFITMQVNPDEVGFPRYGFPLQVAAGQLLATDQAVSMVSLRNQHDSLGNQCLLQAYLQRASFFNYLAEQIGNEAFIELFYQPTEPSDSVIQSVFGRTFSDLETSWRQQLLAEYNAYPDNTQLRDQFLNLPPIRSQPLCPGN